MTLKDVNGSAVDLAFNSDFPEELRDRIRIVAKAPDGTIYDIAGVSMIAEGTQDPRLTITLKEFEK